MFGFGIGGWSTGKLVSPRTFFQVASRCFRAYWFHRNVSGKYGAGKCFYIYLLFPGHSHPRLSSWQVGRECLCSASLSVSPPAPPHQKRKLNSDPTNLLDFFGVAMKSLCVLGQQPVSFSRNRILDPFSARTCSVLVSSIVSFNVLMDTQ